MNTKNKDFITILRKLKQKSEVILLERKARDKMLTNMLRLKNASIVSTCLRSYASQVVKMPDCDFKPEKYKVNIQIEHIHLFIELAIYNPFN